MTEFRIRRGNPTAEEIAIAISVLRAAAGAQDISAVHAPARNWAAPHRSHRAAQHIYGRGAWTLAQRIR